MKKRLTIENVNLDDDHEMRRRGLLDAEGNLLVKELPLDMREASEREFGAPTRLPVKY